MLRKLLTSRVFLWTAPLAWMGLIFYLSAQSTLPSLSDRFGFQDVAGHFTVYAVLAVLWQRALASSGVRRAGWWALALALLYGFSDEFHQRFVPSRASDLLDVATDLVGAAVGLGVAGLFRRGRRRQVSGW